MLFAESRHSDAPWVGVSGHRAGSLVWAVGAGGIHPGEAEAAGSPDRGTRIERFPSGAWFDRSATFRKAGLTASGWMACRRQELTKIADTLSEKETAGRLRQLWERWIYNTCLCFALDLEEQKKSTFQYQYSVFQVEYSRNLWFRSGRQMEEISGID
jgi:hypothetical protein